MIKALLAALTLSLSALPALAQDANRSNAVTQCTAAFERGWLRTGGYLYTRMKVVPDTAALPDAQVQVRTNEHFARATGYSTSTTVLPISATDRSQSITWRALVSFNLTGFQRYDAQTRTWSGSFVQHIICRADIQNGKLNTGGIEVRVGTGSGGFDRPTPGSFPR